MIAFWLHLAYPYVLQGDTVITGGRFFPLGPLSIFYVHYSYTSWSLQCSLICAPFPACSSHDVCKLIMWGCVVYHKHQPKGQAPIRRRCWADHSPQGCFSAPPASKGEGFSWLSLRGCCLCGWKNSAILSPCILPSALLPSMIKRRRGHIVAISSIQGRIGIPFRSACEYFLPSPGIFFFFPFFFFFLIIKTCLLSRIMPYTEYDGTSKCKCGFLKPHAWVQIPALFLTHCVT